MIIIPLSYLDHRKILTFYAYGCFLTANRYLRIFQFGFLMQIQPSLQKYFQ